MAALTSLTFLLALLQPAAEVRVNEARFFAIDTRSDPPGVADTTRIPHRPNSSCFGWILYVAPRPGRVTLREELRLPAPASNWGSAPGSRVHDDRAGATTELTDDLEDGILANEWCLSEGDPLGAHSVQIYLGDRLLHRFDFTVVEEATRI